MSLSASFPVQATFLPRLRRIVILLVIYSAVCAASAAGAYLLRFDFTLPPEVTAQLFRLLPWVILTKVVVLVLFGQFSPLLSYFSLPDAQRLFGAMLTTGIAGYFLHHYGNASIAPPRSVVLSDFIFSFSALCAARLTLRMVRERVFSNDSAAGPFKRIGVIGAGDVGASLVKEWAGRPGLRMKAIAFADDNRQKWKRAIHGVPVLGSPEYLIEKAKTLKIDEIVIAMPSAGTRRVQELVRELNEKHLNFERVPSLEQLVRGSVRVSQLRPVELEDLLGRDPIDLKDDQIREILKGKVALVTGAGGTIGGELCRQILRYNPSLLILVEQCEVLLFQIDRMLTDEGAGSQFVPLVADILDELRMKSILSRYRPDILFHAAAHKHVPMMEHQPQEAFNNNTIGTAKLADWAIEAGVGRFVQISTDKAINPTNVMGATKRMAELYLQAKAGAAHTCKIVAVRFGNVLGSSGSVIPTFKQQIAAGGPVTVTHPEVTRFFMTVSEAVGLVLQSAAQANGGEIFVLDMGKPLKIVDLASQLIELSGLKPGEDIEIRFTGLRPGEKLFEELNHLSESMVATTHPRIMRFITEPRDLAPLRAILMELHQSAGHLDTDALKLQFQKLVPEYKPMLGLR